MAEGNTRAFYFRADVMPFLDVLAREARQRRLSLSHLVCDAVVEYVERLEADTSEDSARIRLADNAPLSQ